MAVDRLYGAVHFRYDPVSEAAIFTLVGADGSEPISITNRLPIELVGEDGSTKVSVNNRYPVGQYEVDIARGNITGAESYGAYGERTTTGAETNILWPDGTYALPPASGVQPSLVSTSANDSSAGTGIRTVDVHYLDTELAEQTETVTMNGTTPVVMVATDVRFITCLHMNTYGSGKSSAGVISCSVGAQVYSQIVAGAVRCSSSVRMVPAGKRLMVTGMYGGSVSGTAAASTKFYFVTSSFEGHDYSADSVFFPIGAAAFQDGSGGMRFNPPIPFEEGAAVGMSFVTDKAATIVGSWFGYLENA